MHSHVDGVVDEGQHHEQRELLRRNVVAAIDEIASIRCPDPAAVDAFLTARLTMHTLRDVWLRNI